MDISNMKEIFKIAFLSNDTVRMIGKHGIGKSKVVKEFAEENGFHLEVLMLSQNEVADLIGIPKIEKGVTVWTKPLWLENMYKANKEGKHCILFLDELSRAPLDVRQAALQLILDRKLHQHKLPELDGKKTLVIAADNPSDLYDTEDLDPALLDRFMNFEVEIDPKSWIKWARKNNIEQVIIDYISEFPDKLHWFENDNIMSEGATPRSWEKVSDIIKNISSINKNLIFNIFVSRLGKVVGSNFYHYYKEYLKVLQPDNVYDFLKEKKIKTKEEIKETAKELYNKYIENKKMDFLTYLNLADKLLNIAKEKNEDFYYNALTTYLTAIPIEITTAIFKEWQKEKENDYLEYTKKIPEKFLIFEILRYKDENLNKFID